MAMLDHQLPTYARALAARKDRHLWRCSMDNLAHLADEVAGIVTYLGMLDLEADEAEDHA